MKKHHSPQGHSPKGNHSLKRDQSSGQEKNMVQSSISSDNHEQHRGGASRSFIISVVTILAVILLVIFLFSSQQFVGQAISRGGNTADLRFDGSSTFTLTMSFMGKEVNGLYVVLDSVDADLCDAADDVVVQGRTVMGSTAWGFATKDCSADGAFSFGDAALDPGLFVDDTLTLQFILSSAISSALPGSFSVTVNTLDVFETTRGDDLYGPVTDGSDEFSFTRSSSGSVSGTPSLPSGAGDTTGSSSSSSGSSGGGSGGCTSEWECGEWSTCDATLEQMRTCMDTKCYGQPREETRACVCEESWSCMEWSSCADGEQRRTCTDEHACSTSALKPAEARTCGDEEMAQLPSDLPEQQEGGIGEDVVSDAAGIPDSSASPPDQQQPWEPPMDFSLLWFILPGGLAVLVLALLIMLVRGRGKKVLYNYEELKRWIIAEKKMGTSEGDIRVILQEHTGWNTEEVEKMLKEAL